MTLSTIAASAIDVLADEMIAREFPANWQAIDRIARRWRLQGRAESRLADAGAAIERHRETERIRYWNANYDTAFHVMPNPYPHARR